MGFEPNHMVQNQSLRRASLCGASTGSCAATAAAHTHTQACRCARRHRGAHGDAHTTGSLTTPPGAAHHSRTWIPCRQQQITCRSACPGMAEMSNQAADRWPSNREMGRCATTEKAHAWGEGIYWSCLWQARRTCHACLRTCKQPRKRTRQRIPALPPWQPCCTWGACGKTKAVCGSSADSSRARNSQPAPLSPRPCSIMRVERCGWRGGTTRGAREGQWARCAAAGAGGRGAAAMGAPLFPTFLLVGAGRPVCSCHRRASAQATSGTTKSRQPERSSTGSMQPRLRLRAAAASGWSGGLQWRLACPVGWQLLVSSTLRVRLLAAVGLACARANTGCCRCVRCCLWMRQ